MVNHEVFESMGENEAGKQVVNGYERLTDEEYRVLSNMGLPAERVHRLMAFLAEIKGGWLRFD